MEAPRGLSAGGPPGWESSLKLFARVRNAKCTAAEASERVQLVNAVLLSPASTSAWLALCAFEDARPSASDSGLPPEATLLSALSTAVQLTPKPPPSGGESLQLWLLYARHLGVRCQDDARDLFKTMRRQRLGDGAAEMYTAWAAMERGWAGAGAALEVVRKGLAAGAEPRGTLEALAAKLGEDVGASEPRDGAAPHGRFAVAPGAAPETPAGAGPVRVGVTPLGGHTPAVPGNAEESTHTLPLRRRLGTSAFPVHTPVPLRGALGPAAGPTPACPPTTTEGAGSCSAASCRSLSASTSSAASVSTSAGRPVSEFGSGRGARARDGGPGPGATPAHGDADGAGGPAAPPFAARRGPVRLGFGGAPARRVTPPAGEAEGEAGERGVEAEGRAGRQAEEGQGEGGGVRETSWQREEGPEAREGRAGWGQEGGGLLPGQDGARSGVDKTRADLEPQGPVAQVPPPAAPRPAPPPAAPGAPPAATVPSHPAQRPKGGDSVHALATPSAAVASSTVGNESVVPTRGVTQPPRAPLAPRTNAAPATGGATQDAREAGKAGEGQAEATGAQRGEASVVVKGTRYRVLECVGRGGSCKVYKVLAPSARILALKRIKLEGKDREAAQGFLDEITLLEKLRGVPHIIQIVDHEVLPRAGLIYVLLEFGETDLARLLAKREKARQERGERGWDENFVRLYWEQMLQAVRAIHEARIVHADLKPANFLVVEGQLKLIDFGIAKAIHQDTTSVVRQSQVGTLNYMSPEAVVGGGRDGYREGRPSDVWSLGCILYQMVNGHTPFAHLAFIQKMHAITDTAHAIPFPDCGDPDCVDAMRRCLDRSPKARATIAELLDHPFLHPGGTRAALAPGPALSAEHLRVLLKQMAAAHGRPGLDVDAMAAAVLDQVARGEPLNLGQSFTD